MKTLFVTGGAGFIGSEFVRLLLNRTPRTRIINFDLLTYAGNPANIEDLDPERHFFVHGDIRNRDDVLKNLPEHCDGIVNFAAESHVDRSIESAQDFITTNVLGTQVLIDCAREKGVKRFVQISTDEVMGSLDETDNPFTEDSPFKPNSPYSASKAAAEHLVRASVMTFKLDAVIVRCGNSYGYRQHVEKFIPKIIVNALENRPIPVYDDGEQTRDWIFVTDCCEAIWRVLQDGKTGETYNIGARTIKKNNEVARSILKLLGKPNRLISNVPDRPGHDRCYAIDPSKIETTLGWKPKTSWDDGLQKTVDWYLQNKSWLERIRI